VIELTYNIKPIAHQSVRAAKGRFYQPEKINNYKKTIQLLTKTQLPKGFKMYPKHVPIVMIVDYLFKYRKQDEKKYDTWIPKVTKPDVTDNLNKKICDSLEGIVYQQDQQICKIVASKWWAKENKIIINIHEWEE